MCKRTIGKIKTLITQNEYLLSSDNYCAEAEEDCKDRCDHETWWESKVGYAEAYAQCLRDWASHVGECVNECNEDIGYLSHKELVIIYLFFYKEITGYSHHSQGKPG